MRVREIYLSTLSITLVLSGCAGGGAGPLGIGAIAGNRNLASAEPLFSKGEQDCLGSADLLVAALFAPTGSEASGLKKKSSGACARIRQNLRYLIGPPQGGALLLDDKGPGGQTAGTYSITSSHYTEAQRNELIDALLAASNQKCTRYTALLKNADGAMNAGLSVGSILTGGLGSILPGAGTARALAGTSSILSGSRAALNDTYLSNQTIHVLSAAFEKARRAQRHIITNREACTVEQYTVMRGIEDAYTYHNSCSLVAGLAETALSIERSENPGLATMRSQLNELTNLRRQMSGFTETGPITPIAASPRPVSLESLVAADQTLTDAQTAVNAAAKELDTATANEITAKAKPDNAVAIKTATDAVAAAAVKFAKLTTARDNAGKARNAEVQALVHATTFDRPATDPETRVCPFNA